MADIETEVELLKSKVSDMEKLHVRLDDAIGKISEVSNCINRMLAVHEEKLANQEEAVFAAEQKLHTDINKRVGVLEKWRHVLIGGSIVIGFVLHRMIDFS